MKAIFITSLAIIAFVSCSKREDYRFIEDLTSTKDIKIIDDSNIVETVMAELKVPARGKNSCAVIFKSEARIGCRCVDPGIPKNEIDPHKMAYTLKETQRDYGFSGSLTTGLAQTMRPTQGRFIFLAENMTEHEIVLQIYRQENKEICEPTNPPYSSPCETQGSKR